MSTPRTPPHFATLIFLAALSPMTLNLFVPSLSNIARDFDVSYGVVSLSVAGYLAVVAVIQLIIGPLSDRFGRRPVLLAALVIFTLASIVAALAQSIWVFLAARAMQSTMTAGFSMTLAVIRDTTPGEKAAGRIGYMSMVMAVAPMLGPVLGGVLDTAFGWRSNFWFFAGMGVFLLALVWIDLGETHQRKPKPKGANPTRALLRDPPFWGFVICTAFSTAAFHIFIAGAPFVADAEFGTTTAELGVYIGSITAGFMVGGALSGRFASQFKLTTMMVAGRLAACGGLLVGVILWAQVGLTPVLLFGATIFAGLGNGLTMPASNAGAMSVNPQLAGSAAGISGATTVGLGALVTALTGVLLPLGAPALTLLLLMFAVSAVGLLAALLLIRHDRQTQDRLM